MTACLLGVCVALMAFVMLWAPAARGDGIRDLADGWLLEARHAARLVQPGDSGRNGWSCECGRGRPYDIPDLDQLGLSARVWRPHWEGSGSWERLQGGSLYTEDQVGGWFLAGAAIRGGLEVRWRRIVLGTVPVEPAFGVAALVDWVGSAGVQVRCWIPVVEPEARWATAGPRRWARCERIDDNLAWVLAIDRRPDGGPLVQVEVNARVASIAALGLRFDGGTGTLGFCTIWRVRSVVMRSSHLVHPQLGPTHRWSVILGRWS